MSTGPKKPPDPSVDEKLIIYFDGVCNLCNHVVDFFIHRDKNNTFLFCSLQSETAARRLPKVLLETPAYETVVVEYRGKFWVKSRAVLLALMALKGLYRCAALGFLLPQVVTDFVYDLVARNRYSWFGKRNSCRLPTSEEKNKFL